MARKWTDEEFDGALYEVVREQYENNPAWVLEVPGIYEIMAEHHNNDVLDWLEEHNESDPAEVKATIELIKSDYPDAVVNTNSDGSIYIEDEKSGETWDIDQLGNIVMHNGEWV